MPLRTVKKDKIGSFPLSEGINTDDHNLHHEYLRIL